MMRFIQNLRRIYADHAAAVKLSGVVLFLVVVASLYVAVLYRPASSQIVLVSTPTPSPTPTVISALSTTPTPQPTAAPPGALPVPRGSYQVVVQTNISYGQLSDTAERLDLCTPVGAAGLRPGVVLIHGGGFVAGKRTDDAALCWALASHGFVVATLGYRLAATDQWPAPLVDVQLAVRWMRTYASFNRLDPKRLCAVGDSAGGNLSVFLGTLATIHSGDQASLLTNQSPKASCVVDEFGPVDMAALVNVPGWAGIFGSMFGTANPNNPAFPHDLRDSSPLFSVSSQSAPTLIIQGASDTVVPAGQSLELQHALRQSGVPVTYISYAGGHEYSGLSAPQRQAIYQQLLAFLTAQEHP